MKKITNASVLLGALLALSAAGNPANASVIISGSSGTRAAQATFDVSGNNLVVTLANTSNSDVLTPVDVLTAVLFNLSGLGANTLDSASGSAVLGSGSSVVYDPDGQPAGGVVGGEWGYKDTLNATDAHGATKGISSSGLGGLFDQPSFPGSNLAGPVALDGLQYGLLSAGDDTATGNGGVTGGGGLIKNSVVFTLLGLPDRFDLTGKITNVWFQYGTDISEPGFCAGSDCGGGGGGRGSSVPEPATLALLGVGMAGLAAARRRKI